MSRLTKIELTEEQRLALEKGYKFGAVHGFRQRCLMILLKSQKKTSLVIGQQLDCHLITVNHWVKRYQAEGIAGLHIKEGRGRRAILHKETDLPTVRLAVEQNRQRLSMAQETLQQELSKKFSQTTLKRFLKKTIADTDAYESE